MKRLWIAVLLALALGCGRYGPPIRPEPPPPPPQEAPEEAPDEEPEEPDFRLDLPGLPGSRRP